MKRANKKIKSIHSQISMLYSIAVVALLVMTAVAFFWEEQNVINRTDYNFLTDEVTDVQYLVSNTDLNKDILKQKIINQPVNRNDSLYRYYIRVMDGKGKTLLETPGMSDVDASGRVGDSDRYLSIKSPVVFKGGKHSGVVQVVLDTSYQHTITQDRRIFMLMLVISVILSLLLGRYIANRGLRSLDTLTDTVENITTSSLNKRVNPNEFPEELTPLGNAFNQMLDRIELSFARMKQMSADMSHELRTPITNLIGQTELMLSYEHAAAERQDLQASNLEELQRMSSLVENILFLARAESQQPSFDKEIIQAEDEVNKVCEYYQAVADEKNIELTQYGSASLRVNVVMFRRLLNNIISNAVKYTPEHGKVSITISDERDAAEIHVIDNGMGIAEEHLPKIFDRFYRVDAARSSGINGTGLGLAIAKSIVDQHHGTISILSALGAGTEIIISLPK